MTLDLRDRVRDVPDFPTPGIVFKDLMPLIADPAYFGGGLTAEASDKMTRFVDLCDQFRLPVVNFVDQPGFVIGTAAERAEASLSWNGVSGTRSASARRRR